MRILGLDIGTKRIGVAVSDELALTARSLKTILRNGYNIKEILDIASEYKVDKIVVGLPLKLDGSVGESALISMEFTKKIKDEYNGSVVEWDERFSTKEAENIMIEADISRKKRKKSIDKLAAQIILQNYLDSNN